MASSGNYCFTPPMEYAKKLGLKKAVSTTWVRIKPVQDLSLTGSLTWATRSVGLQQAKKAEGIIITPTITYDGNSYRFKVHATVVPYVLVADFTRNGLYTVTVSLKLRGVDPKTGKVYDNAYSPLLAEEAGIGKILVVWTAFGDEGRTQPLAWGFKSFDAANAPSKFTIDIQEEIANQGKNGAAVRGYRLEVWAVPNIDLPSYQTFASQVQAPDTSWIDALGRVLAGRFLLLAALEGTDDAVSAIFTLKNLGAELEEAGVSKSVYSPLLSLSSDVITSFRSAVSSMSLDVPSSALPGIYEAGAVEASIPKASQAYRAGGKLYLRLPGGLKVSDADFLQSALDIVKDYAVLKAAVDKDMLGNTSASPDTSLLAAVQSLSQSIPIFGSYAGLLLAAAGGRASLVAQSVLSAVTEEIRRQGKDAAPELLSAVTSTVARLGGITELGPTFPAAVAAELEDGTWVSVLTDLGSLGTSVYLPDQVAQPLRYEFSAYLGVKRVAVYGLFDAVDLNSKATDAKVSWKIEDSQVPGKKEVVITLDYDEPVFLVGQFPGDPFGASLLVFPGDNTITIDEDLEEEWRQFLESAEPYKLTTDLGALEEYEDPEAQMVWDGGPIIVPLKPNYVVKYGWDLQALAIMKNSEGLSSVYVYTGAKYGLASFKQPAEDSFWLAKWYQEKDGLFSSSLYQSSSEKCEPGDAGCPIVAKDGGYGVDINLLESKLGGQFLLVLARAVPRFVPSIPPAPETVPSVVWFSRRVATISSWYSDDTATHLNLTIERGEDTSVTLYLQPLVYKEVTDPSTGEVKVVPAPIYDPVKASVSLPADVSSVSITVEFSNVDKPEVSVSDTNVTLKLPSEISGQYFGLSIRAVSPTLSLPVLPARALNTVANMLWKAVSAVYGAVSESGQLEARVVASQLPPGSTYDSDKDEIVLPFGSFKPYELLLLKQYALFLEGDTDALFGDAEAVARETRTKTPGLHSVWFAAYYGPAVDVLIQDFSNIINKSPTTPALVSSAQQVIAQLPNKVASIVALRKPSEVQVRASGVGTSNEVITLVGDGRIKLAVDVAVKTALATSPTGFTQTVVLTDKSPIRQVPVNDIAYVTELYTVVGYAEDPDDPNRSLVEWAADFLAQKREELNITNAVSSPTVVATLAAELLKKAAKLYTTGKIDFATLSSLMRFMMGYVPIPVEVELRADGLAVFGSLMSEESNEPPAVDGVKLTYWIGGSFEGAVQVDPEDPGKAYETVAQKLFSDVKDKVVAFASGSITEPGEAFAVFDAYTEYQIEGKTYSGYQVLRVGYTVPSAVRKAPDTTPDSLLREIMTGAVTTAVERAGSPVLQVSIDYVKPTLSPIQATKLSGITYWTTAESIPVPVLFYEISSLGIGLPKWSRYQIVGQESWFVGLWLCGIKGYVTTSASTVNAQNSYVYVIESQGPTKPVTDKIVPVQPKASAVPVLPAGFTSPISFSVQLSDAGSFGQLLQTEIGGEKAAEAVAWVTDGTAVRHFPDWDKDLSKESLVALPRSLPTAGVEVLIQLKADVYAGIKDAVAVRLNEAGEVLPAYVEIDFSNIQGQEGTYKVVVNPDGSKEIVGTAGWSYTIYQKELRVGGAEGAKASMVIADQYKVDVTGTAAVAEGETSDGYEKQFMVSFSVKGLPDGLLSSDDIRVAVRMRTYSPAGIRTSSWDGVLESTSAVINWTEKYDKDGNLVSLSVAATGLKPEEGVSEDYAEYLKNGVLSPDQTTGPASFEMVLALQTKDEDGSWKDVAVLGKGVAPLPSPQLTAQCSDDKKSFTVQAVQMSYARKISIKGCFIAVPYEGGYSCAESCLTAAVREAKFEVEGGEPLVGAYSAYDPLTKATYDARIVCSRQLVGGVKSGSYVVVAAEHPGVVVPDMYAALAKNAADKLYIQEFIDDLVQLSALPYAVAAQPDADVLCALTSKDSITADDAYKLLGISSDALPGDAAVQIAELLVKAAKDSGDCRLAAYAGWQAMLGVVPTDLLTKAKVLAGYLTQRGTEAHVVAPGINFMVVQDPTSDYYLIKMALSGASLEQIQSSLLVDTESGGLKASASPEGTCIGTGGGVEEEVSPLKVLGPIDELATSGGEFLVKLTGNEPTKNTLVIALPLLAALVLAVAGTARKK